MIIGSKLEYSDDLTLEKIDKGKSILIDTNIINILKRNNSKMDSFCQKVNDIQATVFIPRHVLAELVGEKAYEKAENKEEFYKYAIEKIKIIKNLKDKIPIKILGFHKDILCREIHQQGQLKDVFVYTDCWVENLFENDKKAIEYILETDRKYNEFMPKIKSQEDISICVDDNKIYEDFIKYGFNERAKYSLTHRENLEGLLLGFILDFINSKDARLQFTSEVAISILTEEKYYFIRSSFIIVYCQELNWKNQSLKKPSNENDYNKVNEEFINEVNNHWLLPLTIFTKYFIFKDSGLKKKCEDIKNALPISTLTFEEFLDLKS